MECKMFDKDIYVVEGFDRVGKTSFMKKELPDFYIYHATHDLTDQTVGRNNSWVIGYGVMDFLQQVHELQEIVIDRGVFSSYVYQRLYGPKGVLDPRVLDYYKNNKFFHEDVGHIYVRHHDVDSAREIYIKSQSREKNPNQLSNKYDQFNTFDDYWKLYSMADALFSEVYSYIGIKPRIFETIPDGTYREVIL